MCILLDGCNAAGNPQAQPGTMQELDRGRRTVAGACLGENRGLLEDCCSCGTFDVEYARSLRRSMAVRATSISCSYSQRRSETASGSDNSSSLGESKTRWCVGTDCCVEAGEQSDDDDDGCRLRGTVVKG
jgi:hypothetical protein